MKLKYKFVVQEVSDGFVAVAVGADAAKFSGIIRMNRTSAFVFKQLMKDVSEDEIVAGMCEKYDGDEQVMRKDAQAFIKKLAAADLLA